MPSEGGFQTICRTCAEEEFSDTYPEAHEFFADHAERGHEVDLVNLDAVDPLRSPSPPQEDEDGGDHRSN